MSLQPSSTVRRELARILTSFAAAPFHALGFLVRRKALREEFVSYLARPAQIDEPPQFREPSRSPRVFVSCAEASGELHAVNFVRELRALSPQVHLAGLGGKKLAAERVEVLDDPVRRATMGFDGVLQALPYYVNLLERCAEHFRDDRPDVVVLIDSPALHVPLARIARRYGLRVLHFVTPQHWAWAPWRASDYARSVDRALTILPFEPAWFARRGVRVAHVGHPLLDQLTKAPSTRAADNATTIVVLPGSRTHVIELNLPWMLSVLKSLRNRVPTLDVTIAQSDDEHRAQIDDHVARIGTSAWTQVELGDLHGSLSRARAAFSVSGTILLDVLHHRLPTTCIYRVATARDVFLHRHALVTPFFASVNLLAGREIVPEFCFRGTGPVEQVLHALELSYTHEAFRRTAIEGLELAAERLGPSGACRRAALHAIDLARGG